MADGSNPSLSIVIPAYNEERRLPETILNLRSFFSRVSGLEIIIVIEKSSDETVHRAREAVQSTATSAADGSSNDQTFRIVANDVHRGKGFAVKTGMQLARGEIIFFMDADLSTPLAEIFKFIAEFQIHQDIDIVIGSRAETESQILREQSWLRRNLGRGFNRFVQAFGVVGIRDTQCGFKAFRRRAAQDIFSRLKTDGFAFDVEILVLAQLMGYKVKTVPVRWVNSPDSKLKMWIDPLKMLIELVQIKRKARQSLKDQPLAPKS